MASKSVKLTLSERQAFTLRMILDMISGGYDTRRNDAASITSMLIDAGVPYATEEDMKHYVSSSLREICFIA